MRKLKTADRQLADLKDELDSLDEKREKAQEDYLKYTDKNQVQVRMRMTDAVFGRMVVDMRTRLKAMTPVQKARYDGEFLMAIAEQPNEKIKCAMYLFFGYLDGAIQFAQTCGSGGSSSDLPWRRDPDEDVYPVDSILNSAQLAALQVFHVAYKKEVASYSIYDATSFVLVMYRLIQGLILRKRDRALWHLLGPE